jgi:N-ethylmaleimide reductase
MSKVCFLEHTTIGAIQVSNHIAMAPLTRSRADKDGVHSSLAVEYYRQRASAGLIITEATNISRQGRGYPFTPGIYTNAHVEAWRRVTDAVHQAGGKIVCQLWHVGRMSHVLKEVNFGKMRGSHTAALPPPRPDRSLDCVELGDAPKRFGCDR